MNTTFPATIARATNGQRPAILQLLQAENLPTSDIPASLNHFFAATDADKVIGSIGLERYGSDGLLRSMVVDREYRKNHIAAGLVRELEEHAITEGIRCLYLLTVSAAAYFEKKGYQRISREAVPKPVRMSAEFQHLCPASAIAMKKQIQ
jgi:amino-acid N-acetyltransferase